MTYQQQAVEYEMDMFSNLCSRLDDERAFESRDVHDAVVESALLHMRALADFFLGTAHGDDIQLENVAPKFRSDYAKEIDALRDAWGDNDRPGCPKRTINKRVMHLTEQRSRNYDYRAVRDAVLSPLQALTKAMRSEIGRH